MRQKPGQSGWSRPCVIRPKWLQQLVAHKLWGPPALILASGPYTRWRDCSYLLFGWRKSILLWSKRWQYFIPLRKKKIRRRRSSLLHHVLSKTTFFWCLCGAKNHRATTCVIVTGWSPKIFLKSPPGHKHVEHVAFMFSRKGKMSI
ncbi:Hypothetical protein FKW44_015632 [Caligus rogercresseyi]|uniref:Uncharacterized protein n=1 Tax=Caligus rogercresseyi TaxID=217165 RepID=A0A7T8H0L4_CALRO|nr:Hypothetical protein FKW44_015632 [Caligus rogercresseyi]